MPQLQLQKPVESNRTIFLSILFVCFIIAGLIYGGYWIYENPFPYKPEILLWGFLGLIAIGHIAIGITNSGGDGDYEEEEVDDEEEKPHQNSEYSKKKSNDRQIGYVIDNGYSLDICDENGHRMWNRVARLVNYTSSTVTIEYGNSYGWKSVEVLNARGSRIKGWRIGPRFN